jgi:hypothetical protein
MQCLNFYGGKKSVITQQTEYVQWAHILDAAPDSSNPCVRPHNYCHSLVLNAVHCHSSNGCLTVNYAKTGMLQRSEENLVPGMLLVPLMFEI